MSSWDDEKFEVNLPATPASTANNSAVAATVSVADEDWVSINDAAHVVTRANWKAHQCQHCTRKVCLIWTGGECLASTVPTANPPAPVNEAGSNRTDVIPLDRDCEFCQSHTRYHCELTRKRIQPNAFELTEDKNNLETLSDKILGQLFSYLPGNVLAKASQACKRFFRVSNEVSLWERHFQKINREARNRALFQTIRGNTQSLDYIKEAYRRWYIRNSPICTVCEKYCRRVNVFNNNYKEYLCQTCEKHEYISADKAISHFRLDEKDLAQLEGFPKKETPELEVTYFKFLHVYYTAYWKSKHNNNNNH